MHGSLVSAGEEHRKKTFENGVAVDVSESSTTTTKKKQQQQKTLTSLPLPDEEASLDKDETDLDDEQQQLPFRPKAFLPPKVAVVIPLITSQIETALPFPCLVKKPSDRATGNVWAATTAHEAYPSTSSSRSRARGSTRAAPPETKPTARFRASWTSPTLHVCSDKVHTRAANLMPSEDIHTAYVFTGPNLQFRRMMNDSWLRYRFSHMLL